MTVTLATVATEFLERKGLAQSTLLSYEMSLLPLLKEYGSYPIEILSRETLTKYLEGLTDLAYTTHHRHQAILQALFNFAVERLSKSQPHSPTASAQTKPRERRTSCRWSNSIPIARTDRQPLPSSRTRRSHESIGLLAASHGSEDRGNPELAISRSQPERTQI